MKKTIYTVFILAVAAVLSLSLAACGSSDPLKQTEKAFAEAVETAENLDNPDESDLSESNVQMSASGEVSGAVRLSSDSGESEVIFLAEGTAQENIRQIKDALAYIRARQQELQGYKSSVKIEITTFKANVKTFRSEELTLTDDEKVILGAYINEIKSLNQAIKDTIGNVYAALRDAKSKYTLATIDDAVTELNGIVAQMDIRVNSAKRLYEIAVELNAMLSAKVTPAE